MFRPNNLDQDQDEERTFVQKALMRRFVGDQQLLYKDLPAFMEHPELKGIMGRYLALQDEIHATFLAAGFGAPEPEIALEAADPDLADLPAEILLTEAMDASIATVEDPTELIAPIDEIEEVHPGLEVEEVAAFEPIADDMADPELPSEPQVDATAETPAPQEVEADDAVPTDEIDTPIEKTKPIIPPSIPVKLNLPNGKIGQDYLQKIDISPLHRSLESLLEVVGTGFEAVGLSFTHDGELKIEGQPDDHGKFPVEILLRFAADGDRPAQDYRLQGEIDILPDPRKLWKELEPDASLPFQKSHFRSEALHMAGRTMIAASRRGRSHAHNGTFRDDEFELRVNEAQQWYIMAVADGAGSAPYSRRGSQIACDKAMEVLETKLNDERLATDIGALAGAWSREPSEQLRGQIRNRIYEALSHAAYAGYKAICEEAEAMGESPKAFHTTFLLTIVRQYDFGYFVATWWVGDGAVGVLQRGKYHKLMGIPDGGQFAGQTRFLTMPEIWTDGATVAKRIEFDVVQDFTAVVVMSDGVSDPKFQTDHNLLQRENWDALWDELSEVIDFEHDNLKADEQLLDWLDFWAAGEHDDRTIAILF